MKIAMLVGLLALAGCQANTDGNPAQAEDGAGATAGAAGAEGSGEPPEVVALELMKIYGLAQAFDTLVAVGEHFVEDAQGARVAGVVLTSKDGVIWQERVRQEDASFHDVLTGNDRLVVTGYGFEGRSSRARMGLALSSTDAETWTQVELPSPPALWHGASRWSAFGNEWFVTTGKDAMLRSRDGEAWEAFGAGRERGAGLAFANGWFVSVGEFGGAVSDGESAWLDAGLGDSFLVELDARGDSFELVIEHDCCFKEMLARIRWSKLRSEDGRVWSTVAEDLQAPPASIAFVADDLCIALQELAFEGGAILAGPSCDSLAVAFSEPPFRPHTFLEASGAYWVGAQQGLFKSTDGLTWEPVNLLP